MIETMDGEATTGTEGEAADQAGVAQVTIVVGECRCLACESLIPSNAIRVQPLADDAAGRRVRARRVHLYCGHCDLTYELVQCWSADGWTNSAMTTVVERASAAATGAASRTCPETSATCWTPTPRTTTAARGRTAERRAGVRGAAIGGNGRPAGTDHGTGRGAPAG